MRHKLKHKLMRYCVIETLVFLHIYSQKPRQNVTSNPRENTSSTLEGYFVF